MRVRKPKGRIPPAGCEYRQGRNGSWGLFSKSPFNEPGFIPRRRKNEPLLGFVGNWKGCTAPPPRVGVLAPRRWAAEQPTETPPYLNMKAQAFESAIWAVTSGVSNDPQSKQRIRDLKAHIYERACESGLAFAEFKDGEQHPTCAQFASGIRYAETEGEPGYHKVQLRQFIDGSYDDHGKPMMEFEVISKTEDTGWREKSQIMIPLGIDSAIAAQAGFEFEEVASVVEARRKKPLRPRKKPGRKPIGDHVMSGAERCESIVPQRRKFKRSPIQRA